MNPSTDPVTSLVEPASVIFWDFDGVIKDSVDIKTYAYEMVFSSFGDAFTRRVKDHHERNSGVSRYEKIPLYLGWAGEPATVEQVDTFCARFSEIAMEAVINSPWVPGVCEYIKKHFSRQYFVIVTATPQEEIEQIIAHLDITSCFQAVYGAPIKKADAIRSVLVKLDCAPDRALMIGDSEADLASAEANAVPFLLRQHRYNVTMQGDGNLMSIKDLNFK